MDPFKGGAPASNPPPLKQGTAGESRVGFSFYVSVVKDSKLIQDRSLRMDVEAGFKMLSLKSEGPQGILLIFPSMAMLRVSEDLLHSCVSGGKQWLSLSTNISEALVSWALEQEMSVSRSPMARREGGTGVETSEGIKWPRNL